MITFPQDQTKIAGRHRTRAAVIPIIALTVITLTSCAPNASPPPAPASTSTLVNRVVFVEEPDSAKATRELEAGDIQVYAGAMTDPELVRRIKTSPAMGYEISYGSSSELTFNPVGPTFPKTGKLNPFSVPAIREAVNWLIDRKYIAEELYGGSAVPRYFAISTAFPDYAKLAPAARTLEAQYAYNPPKAREVITAEMKKLGAVLTDGKWSYQGNPVELNFLIRTEDRRKDVGGYVAAALEGLGFVVNRQYKAAADASPIWIGSDPGAGAWNLYTGGWASTVIDRDQAGSFSFFYTSKGRPEPLWQAYKPGPDLDKVADTLARRDYHTPDERQKLMADALRLSIQDSVRIWLVDTINISPRASNVAVAADLAGGVSGSWLWPYTLRYTDKTGGSITVASPGLLTEPWNPVAGTNWLYDTMIMRGTESSADLPDPFTGLLIPNRIKSADVYIQEGLPVTRTYDWLTLNFLPTIPVPQDAWINWDATAQRFRTVGEVEPKGLTARTKTVVRYSDDLFKTRWQDGTSISMADVLLGLALSFDRPQKESAIFDESEVPSFQMFLKSFKGIRIVQENPLVAEVYSDQIFPDAEWIADSAAGYFYTAIPWQMLSIGILAEANRELAFSSSKADQLKLEWMSYIAGPSLPILERYRLQALKDSTIPYPNFMGKYVSTGEAAARYTALGNWFKQRGHFWVSNGPFYIESVHPVQKTIVLQRSDDYLKTDDKWLAFTSPRIAEVKTTGLAQLRAGAAAEFQIAVSFKGSPYPLKDIDFIRFLLLRGDGTLVSSGNADPVRDGTWQVKLSAEQSKQLQIGAYRLETIAAPRIVSVASFGSFTFAVIP